MDARCSAAEALARATGRPVEDPRAGFNVAALLLAPIWMIAHGLRAAGLLVLVPALAIGPLVAGAHWVPLVFVASIPLAAGLALAFVGNRIAVAYTGLETPSAFSASQLPWALAGTALHTVVLPWTIYLTGLVD